MWLCKLFKRKKYPKRYARHRNQIIDECISRITDFYPEEDPMTWHPYDEIALALEELKIPKET